MCLNYVEEDLQGIKDEEERKREESGILFPEGGEIFVVRDEEGCRKTLERIKVPPGARVIIQKKDCDYFLEEA